MNKTNLRKILSEKLDRGQSVARKCTRVMRSLILSFRSVVGLSEALIPDSLKGNADNERRARMLIWFGILGAVLGVCFSTFYLLIEHIYGGVILGIFSGAFSLIPFGLKHSGNLRVCSNFYLVSLTAGFTGISLIEGGMNGHAVAWLSVIPLCAMILANKKDAIFWCGTTILLVSLFGYWHLNDYRFPEFYPYQHKPLVDAVGYGALIPFLVFLGFIFESTRRRAFSQSECAMKRLTAANEGLVKLNKEKNEFLNIAAHDLKNPLSVITGFSDLIKSIDGLSEDETKKFATEISNSASRMLDIVTKLLDVRSIEDGEMKLEQKRCSIRSFVNRAIGDFESIAQRKEIELIVTHETRSAAVRGDATAISQILDNLISNAIKYSPPGAVVKIVTREIGGFVEVDVVDEGPGLSKEDQGNLFQKFSRLTPKPTGDETSNGLGLWIVDRMAKSMGGQVFCRSDLGRGSTFALRLPSWTEKPFPERMFDSRSNRNEEADLVLPA